MANATKEKLCAVLRSHAECLCVLVTVAGGVCVAVCALVFLGYATTSFPAYLHSAGFTATTCTVMVSSGNIRNHQEYKPQGLCKFLKKVFDNAHHRFDSRSVAGLVLFSFRV